MPPPITSPACHLLIQTFTQRVTRSRVQVGVKVLLSPWYLVILACPSYHQTMKGVFKKAISSMLPWTSDAISLRLASVLRTAPCSKDFNSSISNIQSRWAALFRFILLFLMKCRCQHIVTGAHALLEALMLLLLLAHPTRRRPRPRRCRLMMTLSRILSQTSLGKVNKNFSVWTKMNHFLLEWGSTLLNRREHHRRRSRSFLWEPCHSIPWLLQDKHSY